MGKRYTPEFDDEDELQQWLQKQFESAGWMAFREVSPSNSNYRADLIVHHTDYDWIGIETKWVNTPSAGGKIAEGFRQITQQYRGRRYGGNRIDLWVIAPYFNFPEDQFATSQFIREFFSYFGIGYLDFGRWGLCLEFDSANSDRKVLVKNMSSYDKDHTYGDIDVISEYVEGRVDRL